MAATNLDALLAKRREVVGDAHTFPVEFAGTTFHFIAPELASAEWNDRHTELREDAADGIIFGDTLRAEMTDLILGDEAEAFIEKANEAGVDPLSMIGWAMQDHAEHVGKTQSRQSSNRSQRRARQR
ncbi:hypothetical protein I6J72_05455 [Corynebacterium sp. FDAARGOS 1242]|uniref:hypothetical protein n=1 Tax=Corynebacterium sp. FDAARGOS 1242 TaxID=2778078 RepID=UPI0019516BF9|nr:hypothetical protein [Corynebacterium sp. FDAARGOS 1242]QRP98947.1 hypothetical protein I6J72_05455 [Corynebacterium sp. FDAARGOS 1242]